MKPVALERAKSRLRSAAEMYDQLQETADVQSFEDKWYLFLTAWKSVFTILEQGSKDTPTSKVWFDSKRKEKNEDRLLKYLYEARNDDEHGLGSSAKSDNTHLVSFQWKADETLGSLDINVDHSGLSLGGKLVHQTRNFKHAGPGLKLQIVTARNGNILWPPSPHLGEDVDIDPLNVAGLGLRYIEALVNEAEKLPPPT